MPSLVAGVRSGAWLGPADAVEMISLAEARTRLAAGSRPLVCHARATQRRLGTGAFACFDLLELFAFVHPARFCLPTPRGLAEALDLPIPGSIARQAESLADAAQVLLDGLAVEADADAAAVAAAMAAGGWPWGPAVLAALGAGDDPHARAVRPRLDVWKRIPAWQEDGPLPPPRTLPVEPVEARARLVQLLGSSAEPRPTQAEYAARVAAAFLPRDRQGEPRFVIAESGTGVGKTLGYIAPASVWAEKNGGTVWISTFTRNLQRQLDGELDRLYPDPEEKAEKVVVRKGRENYLCLLNFEEAVRRRPPLGGADAVALGLMARWARASRDGDMVGGDFPAWLTDLLGRSLTVDLTDTRGECIYAACPHYGRCFVEHSQRRARRAHIVVANHALVMVQAALGGDEDGLPLRYVFDEGHHLFEAADAAFSAHLTARETADLRSWVVGAEEGRRTRARGLGTRIGDLIAGNDRAATALDRVLAAARALPGPGWRQRLGGGTAAGAAEAFFAFVRRQVYARGPDPDSPYSLETETGNPVAGLLDATARLEAALAGLRAPAQALIAGLMALLDEEAESLDTASRTRIEAAARGLERRAVLQTTAWEAMLAALSAETPDAFVDWFGVERSGGRDLDVGLYRHWIDPTIPFAEAVVGPAHGILVTSATLRDDAEGEDRGWAAARRRTGADHLTGPVVQAMVPSPFDYAARTRVCVVNDVRRDDSDQVAAAYRKLFVAAGGGALGLFTAISRLRAVHERIAADLDAAGFRLLAQHVDPLDTGTLVDIFRAEEDTCLFGTDAVRDGVDVPGRSLRLIVFDRVPWPRPDILHRARREAFGERRYDDMLTRLKLKQAYGRLIRRADDRGVFVLLDRALPSRLANAFPEGVAIRRLGLAEAIAETRTFLGPE